LTGESWLERFVASDGLGERLPDDSFLKDCSSGLRDSAVAGIAETTIDRGLWVLARELDLALWDETLNRDLKCQCLRAVPAFLGAVSGAIREPLDGLTYFWDTILTLGVLGAELRACVVEALHEQQQLPNQFCRLSADDGLRILAEQGRRDAGG
jgi:hypothetical protein